MPAFGEYTRTVILVSVAVNGIAADSAVGPGRHRGAGPQLGGRRLHHLRDRVAGADRVGHQRRVLGAAEAGQRVGDPRRVEVDVAETPTGAC